MMEDTRAQIRDPGDVRSFEFTYFHSPELTVLQVSFKEETNRNPQEMRLDEPSQVASLNVHLYHVILG